MPIDGPENGPAPLPWDIVVSPPEMFKDNKYYREVPHTASVKVTLAQPASVDIVMCYVLVVRLVTVVWAAALRGVGNAMEKEMYGICSVRTPNHVLLSFLGIVW